MRIAQLIRIDIILLIVLLMHSFFLNAASIDSVFVNLPANISPLLSKQHRIEMLEYAKAQQTDSVKNRLGGFSTVGLRDTVNQLITINTTSTTSLQLKLFKTTQTNYLIGLIKTVSSPVKSSIIEFFDENWNSVSVKFDKPKAAEWYKVLIEKNNAVDTVWLNKLLQNSFISYRFSEEDNIIEAINHSPDFLSIEDRRLLATLSDNKQNVEMPVRYRINCYLCSPFIEKMKDDERK